MPTYQYACTECGHAFEQVQSFSDDALTVCPSCSGKLRKVYNAVGVVFKGSGFYRTDSRDAKKTGAGASNGSSSSSNGNGSSSSSSGSNGSKAKESLVFHECALQQAAHILRNRFQLGDCVHL